MSENNNKTNKRLQFLQNKLPLSRLEGFSDGVIAIIITIMVLEIPLPKTFTLDTILQLAWSVLVFFISFFIVAYYWHRHYVSFAALKEVTNTIIWRNFLFLFSLSLLPVFTKWVLENFGSLIPTIAYSIVYIFVSNTFQFLFSSLISKETKEARNITRKHIIIRNLFLVISIFLILGLTLLSPKLAAILLMAVPLFSSSYSVISTRNHPNKAY